jgi:putative YpdA family bacillithiol system oxidoreductase
LSEILPTIEPYAYLLLCIWTTYGLRRWLRSRAAAALLFESRAAGITEPDSLHPVINPNRCLGCGSCITACPEGDVLGLVQGKAVLVDPSHCIGHGACKEACPTEAIELVLGSDECGVDIPSLGPDFQTNVPGIFVAGELAGMGLIRNAIEQGSQAIASIRRHPGVGSGKLLDVVIVGAGPAGLAASLAAKAHGLDFVTLEQESLGGTVSHYPRGKIVMTAPAELAIVGKVQLRQTTKEALLEFWQGVIEKTGLEIRERERVDAIVPQGTSFEVRTNRGVHRTRCVLLSIGRRGTPRKLDVPGEDLSKVVYRLIDPEQYRGQRVLVVGGGDSAVEAAIAIGEVAGSDVTLSYRGEAFKRVKPRNRELLEQSVDEGRVRVLLRSKPTAIESDHVSMEVAQERKRLPNDAVIVCAGGVLPTDFLRSVGIAIETKRGTPLH